MSHHKNDLEMRRAARVATIDMPIMEGRFKARFIRAPYEHYKIRAERRISCWVDDCYFSLDGRFAVITRDEYVESSTPMRLRTGYSPYRIELWQDGQIVAKCRCSNLAINWLLLKVGTLHSVPAAVAPVTQSPACKRRTKPRKHATSV